MVTQKKPTVGWTFIGKHGEFQLAHPDRSSYLYFPLVNEAGMMSSITPTWHGDSKADQNSFLLAPVSAEDLHNSRAARNFWVYVEGKGAWSAAGNSASQIASRTGDSNEADEVHLEAGLLWHRVIRQNNHFGICAEATSFVPMTEDKVELMQVKITNISDKEIRVTPTAAIPFYARSADDIRDHRHVTSLLHRTYTLNHGVEVQPTLSFDERGHRVNETAYSVLGSEADGTAPIGYFPIGEEFIGEGGSFDWPEAIVTNAAPHETSGVEIDGYESVGALRFKDRILAPGESENYLIAMAITDGHLNEAEYVKEYLSTARFEALLEDNKKFWQAKVGTVEFHSGDFNHDQWMKWVTLQPVLRRLYGCSFLPHHDYGRGGRGWRDLWQDCLALLIMEPADVRHLLWNNYAGVRIDGSNATIIGSTPGEFRADRNNIPRVWMDHGAWPFLTTKLYLDQSGDIEFLFEQQTYFKDSFVKRAKARDVSWIPESGQQLKTVEGNVYTGSILEHILIQNVIPFYHVGAHNNILLEGADWNDGLDMASKLGESVAFTAFYAGNLKDLSDMLLQVKQMTGMSSVEINEELLDLLDTLTAEKVDYASVEDKCDRLERYYNAVLTTVSGVKVSVDIEQLAADLMKKAVWMISHLRQNEWIQNSEGYGWFNGYYNNDGERVEGDTPEGVRMTLTGQVFSIMSGVATEEQVRKTARAVDQYLKDDQIGYRLNSQFGGIQQNLGRAFGFAFGHKENGAMFSHMTVMYAYALYKRGFIHEGRIVLESVYDLCSDYERSRIYPGIPEYINAKGRGMYHFLTGSASWLLLTELTEVFGVKGKLGKLLLEPKLVQEQFDSSGEASVDTMFADKKLRIVYRNASKLDYRQYRTQEVKLNGEMISFVVEGHGCQLERELIDTLADDQLHIIEITLSA
ncbi:GH36-type glycosyl hydrolase domain-containing protein [Paenibacillus popilliae]|uniref:Cellobiose phosphorylase n=1 Tax=Paenibacillus popilliae TaxID=78057 RepID=A0ABY3AUK1_PAEPP|nr:cellobiose phosphorylase [Paenibacillus sp. SDF0028]TQR46421.1 cellobiose phosphorylase [Paenibacillus sp. SDF0028]